MNEHRSTPRNGSSREASGRTAMTEGNGHGALGDVARDVMDHITMIVRDRAKITKLEVSRYGEHLREDVAPKAMWGTIAGVSALLAAVFGLIALFLAITYAIGSVAWAFLIYAVLFAVGTVVAAGFVKRPPHVKTSDEIERRFPSVRAGEAAPQHALVRQETPASHLEVTREAQREATREILTSSQPAAILADDEERRMGVRDSEMKVRSNGHSVSTPAHR